MFALIPALVGLLGPRFRVVNLVRHPVLTWLSHLTHALYVPGPRPDGFARECVLDPSCPGIKQPHYRDRFCGAVQLREVPVLVDRDPAIR